MSWEDEVMDGFVLTRPGSKAGGGKSGGGRPGTRLSTDQLIKDIYYVLPADSYLHIAQKVRRRTGVYVTTRDVTRALFVLRRKSDQYGWKVPHCKRGPSSKDRLFAQHNDSDVNFDDDTLRRYNAGLLGTLGHAFSMSLNAADSLETAVRQMPTLAKRKHAESLLRDLKYVTDKIWDMREDCRQETGT